MNVNSIFYFLHCWGSQLNSHVTDQITPVTLKDHQQCITSYHSVGWDQSQMNTHSPQLT